MTAYRTEEEQLQLIKDWIKKNGSYVILAIVLFVAIIWGKNYWVNSNADYLANASKLYEQMQSATKQEEQLDFANKLNKDYKSTTYGMIAVMYLANQQVEKKDWQEATKQYKWVYENSDIWAQLKVIAFENWLRCLLELKQFDTALNAIKNAEDQTWAKQYPVNFYNLQGDVIYNQDKNNSKNKEEALTAYNKALVAIESNPLLAQQMVNYANWITLKRNDLLAAKPLQ